MTSQLRTRPRKDAALHVTLTASMKERLFDIAAERGVSVAHLTREGIAALIAREGASGPSRVAGA